MILSVTASPQLIMPSLGFLLFVISQFLGKVDQMAFSKKSKKGNVRLTKPTKQSNSYQRWKAEREQQAASVEAADAAAVPALVPAPVPVAAVDNSLDVECDDDDGAHGTLPRPRTSNK